MYNLLIGLTRGEVDASRLLEYTSDDLRQYFAPGMDQVRIERLLNLPTLLMPETRDDRESQIARVGHVTNARRSMTGSSIERIEL